MSRKRKQMRDARSVTVANLLAADKPAEFLRAAVSPLQFDLQADAGTGKPSVKKFSLVAYTGQPMIPSNWYASAPLVLDIQGANIPRQTMPADYEHGPLVGHTTLIETSAQRVYMDGVLSAYSDTEQTPSAQASREITRLAANSFPWQASMEFSVNRPEFIDAGQKVTVNGKSITGPVYVARRWTLRRISIVANGADGDTSASIAASEPREVSPMEPKFIEWLQAKSIDPATLVESVKTTLQSAWEADVKAAAKPAQEKPDGPLHGIDDVRTELRAMADSLKAERAELQKQAAEATRQADIARICQAHGNPDYTLTENGAKRTVNLLAHAASSGWTAKETELAASLCRELKDREIAPRFYMAGSGTGVGPDQLQDVLAAALCQTRQIPDIEKSFKPEVLDLAHKHYRRYGVTQVIMAAAANNGYHWRPGERLNAGNLGEIVRYAMGQTVRAGFSTVSLPGILGDVANKEILAGYMAEPAKWRRLAAIKSVSNFHRVTSYRLLDSFEYEQLGPAGEIKHGSTGEESYTRQARTYAKIFVLTREAMINDDQDAFDDLRQRIGRGGAKALKRKFWLTFLNNSSFFTSARGNYVAHANSTLLTDGVGLEMGVKAFRNLKMPAVNGNDKPELVGGEPAILVVPSDLAFNADRLYMLTNPNGDGADNNIHVKRYEPVVVPELGDSSYTNYSTTAWYLFRNPSEMAPVCVSFLDGQETPVVESSDTVFDTLGIQFRGYHDFGVDLAEYLAGVKSKGAA